MNYFDLFDFEAFFIELSALVHHNVYKIIFLIALFESFDHPENKLVSSKTDKNHLLFRY